MGQDLIEPGSQISWETLVKLIFPRSSISLYLSQMFSLSLNFLIGSMITIFLAKNSVLICQPFAIYRNAQYAFSSLLKIAAGKNSDFSTLNIYCASGRRQSLEA